MINRKKLPVILEHEETQRILEIPNRRYLSGIRNKAILSVMLNMGLRVSEVVNLKNVNVNAEKKKLRVVNGKYAKDRDLTIPGYTLELIEQWKEVRPKSPYFFPTSKA